MTIARMPLTWLPSIEAFCRKYVSTSNHTHTRMHARTEDDGDCTSKRWECRNLDRVFVANDYLLMPEYDSHSFDIDAVMVLWGHDGFSVHHWADTESSLSVRSKDVDRHVSLMMIFCVNSALWTLCPLAGLSLDLLAGRSGFEGVCVCMCEWRCWTGLDGLRNA